MKKQTHTYKDIIMPQLSDLTKLPEVKFNKNGYELRTEILGLAKAAVMEEYHARFHGWEISAERDDKTGHIVTKVGMPEFPGLSQIMATAETMYSFINSSTAKK